MTATGPKESSNASRDTLQIQDRQWRIQADRAARPFRQNVLGETDPRIRSIVRRAVPHLRALHIKGPDAGLDLAFRPKSLLENALSAISQPFIGKPGDKRVSFGLQRLRQHPPRTFTGNLC